MKAFNSKETPYVILCRRSFTFGYLCPTSEVHDWVTPDIDKAYHYGSIEEAAAKVAVVKEEADSNQFPPPDPLEIRVAKIEMEEKAK